MEGSLGSSGPRTVGSPRRAPRALFQVCVVHNIANARPLVRVPRAQVPDIMKTKHCLEDLEDILALLHLEVWE